MLTVFCCQILFFLNCHNAYGITKAKPKTSTRIRSDVIDIKRKTQIVTFLGNVVIEKEDSSLFAQKMILLYEEDTKNKPELQNPKESNQEAKIKRIDAFGKVKIFSDEFIGNGDSGYYEPSKNIFVLQKNVIVNNGSSIATGDEFVYNTVTQKGNFIGKKQEALVKEDAIDKRVMVIIGEDSE